MAEPGPDVTTSPSGLEQLRADFLAPFESLLAQVDAARQADIYPLYPSIDPPVGSNGADQPIILVANDYLGLGRDERVRDAAHEAITRFGTSRCASPLAGGYTALHRGLEEQLARFYCQDAAAVFASGYQANVGVISALMDRGDMILSDMLNHASIIDGARLSGAEMHFFQHNNARQLDRILKRKAKGRRVTVIVEGIYSADGDIGALPELCDVAHAHGAMFMVDEAHSLGVLGAGGRGAVEHFDMMDRVDVVLGTMSKSLASVGGFVVAGSRIVEVIRHHARSLIFSAALPPAGVAAAATSLRIIETEPQHRERLWRNARRMLEGLQARGFDTMNSVTPVVPILVGDPFKTVEFTTRLREGGVLVCPAIPPMVQSRLSRVRAHVTAAHDDATVDRAIRIIAEVGAAVGVVGDAPGTSAATQTTVGEGVGRAAAARAALVAHA